MLDQTRRGGWLAVVLATPLAASGVANWLQLPLSFSPGAGAWWVLWALLASPLLEECIYRLGLQQPASRWLEQHAVSMAGHGANLVAALAMVAVHMPGRGWVAMLWMVPALVLGELFRQTQRVSLCVALHAWFNLCLWWVSRAG